ncbi:MAG: hypothetical protein VCD00_05455 [Candidatus Hydrogenedentota bacterium]
MVTLPGVVGGWLKAIVWVNFTFAPDETVEAKLICAARDIPSDDGKINRVVQWQEDIEVDMGRVTKVVAGQTAIPIEVYIPRDCQQTSPNGGDDRIEWELTTRAKVAGIDLASSFIIPIFVTDESKRHRTLNEHGERVDEIIKPYTPTIEVRDNPDGGISLYVRPRRDLGNLGCLTIFFTFWTAVVCFLLVVVFSGEIGALFFLILFGGTEILIGRAVFWRWFGKAWLDVSKKEIIITKKLFGLGSPKTIRALSETTPDSPHEG